MKKAIYYFILLLCPVAGRAQVIDGFPNIITPLHFSTGTPTPDFTPDASASPLWQIGYSHKTFFGTQMAIMTDTALSYPIHANNWFTIKVHGINTIIDIWHQYQTTAGKDGGIVEFSQDSITWNNVLDSCNSDGPGWVPGVRTTNFYTHSDTLEDGTPAFTGTYSGERYSRLQFLAPEPIRPMSTGCIFSYPYPFYIRFRFVSDSMPETSAGWMIDSITIENDDYPGAVNEIATHSLKVTPNPSYDGSFNFPALENEQLYRLEVFNTIGEKISGTPYKHVLELKPYPPGMYFYKVTDGVNYYAGRLLKE